ncbi:hypothetical protein Xedl_02889 [Xenorhabdus eapokensis]|uniref:DdrB-like domain-containing protein n=1 Tax=Xenorhabdus eapokensis TaxID=1873482 RepID=A0A1Q5TN08_9GAMM|nr:hypothetical protein [Xenorhabdus eapokensis]OKP01613.1 hypothetical protein Xedl_02889 [Xenorhabdus eapokensis]
MTHTLATVQQQPSTAIANAVSKPEYGRVSYVSTIRGNKVKTAFNIVEASDLTISNHLSGRINEAYPQSLQPRDRTCFISQLQVNAIAKNLQPEQLADSALSGEGSPITGRDHIVESGNGRSMGIVKAYASGNADAYKDYLIQNATEYGLNRTLIADMERPVLIRVRLDEVDRAQFARDSNWPDTQNTDENRVTGFFESAPVGNTGVFRQAKSIRELIRNIRGITERNSGTLGKWVGQQLSEIITGHVPVNTGLQIIKSVIGKSKTEFQQNIHYMDLFTGSFTEVFNIKNTYVFREEFIKKVIFDGKGFDIKANIAAYLSANTPIDRYKSANALLDSIKPFFEKKRGDLFCGWSGSIMIQILSDSYQFPKFNELTRDAKTVPNELTLSPEAAESAHQQIITAGKAMMPNFDKALDTERAAIRDTVVTARFKTQLAGTGLYERGVDRIVTALENSRMGYGSCNGDGYQQVLNSVYGGIRDNISSLITPLLEPTHQRLNDIVTTLTELSPTTKTDAETWIKGIKISKTLINRYDAHYGSGVFKSDLIWAYRLAAGRLSTLKEIKLKSSGRSSANESGTISLNPQSPRATLAHELGHHFEFSNPKLLEVVKIFLDTHKMDDGRPSLIRLSDATGNNGFRQDEIAIRDSLSSPYIGKIYARSGRVEHITASEVFSSAFEYLFDKKNGAVSMLNNDGLIEFAIGAIKGVYDGLY